MSSDKIAKLFSVSSPTIQKVLREKGCIRKVGKSNIKYTQDNDFFKIIDTEEKAYWLGFIYADGYITKRNELRINLSADDEDHLHKFYNAIKSNREIKYTQKKMNGNIYKQAYAYIASGDFVKHLISKGCTNNKSLTLKFPISDILPEKLVNHFVRGYFDGDGSIHVSKVNNTGHKNYRLSFVGTEDMLNNIKNILNCSHLKLEDRGSFYCLQINGNIQVLKILDEFIYRDANIYLDRKYKKYLELKAMYS